MIQFGTGFNIPPNFWIGLGIGGFGLFLFFIAYQVIYGPRYQRIEEGQSPDVAYRMWKDKKFMARTSRAALFFLAFAGSMVLAGCATMMGVFSQ